MADISLKITECSQTKKFFCDICNHGTDSQKDYNKHLDTDKHYKKVNNIIKEYECTICSRKFNHRNNLYKHIKICQKKQNQK